MTGVFFLAAMMGVVVGVSGYALWAYYPKGLILRRIGYFHHVTSHANGIEAMGISGIIVLLFSRLDFVIDFDGLGLPNAPNAKVWTHFVFLLGVSLAFVLALSGHSWSYVRAVAPKTASSGDQFSIWAEFLYVLALESSFAAKQRAGEHQLAKMREYEQTIATQRATIETHLQKINALLSTLNRLKDQQTCIQTAAAVVRMVRVADVLGQPLDDKMRAARIWIAAKALCQLVAIAFGGDGKCRVALYIEDNSAPLHPTFKRNRERLRIMGWTSAGGDPSTTPPADLPKLQGLTSLIGAPVLLGQEFWLPEQSSSLRDDLSHIDVQVPHELKRGAAPLAPILLYPLPKHDDFPEGTYGTLYVEFIGRLPEGKARQFGVNHCSTATDLFDAINRAMAPPAKLQATADASPKRERGGGRR